MADTVWEDVKWRLVERWREREVIWRRVRSEGLTPCWVLEYKCAIHMTKLHGRRPITAVNGFNTEW